MRTKVGRWMVGGGLAVLTACASGPNRNQYVRREDGAPLVDEKYSLKADRQEMAKYRSDVPEERRRENDELAFVLQMFQEVKRPPSELREKFDAAVRKKRTLFDHDIQKERDRFTKDERAARDAFLKSQASARESFLRTKSSRTERDDFFREQDEKRREFFGDERDKRADFESDVRERRKSFEDYVREKQNEFNQEYRSYLKRYDDDRKRRQQEEGTPPASPGAGRAAPPAPNPETRAFENEFQEMNKHPATKLESGE